MSFYSAIKRRFAKPRVTIDKYSAPCASYLFPAFYNREENIKRAAARISECNLKIDTLVCTGMSGVIFASPLSLFMKTQLVIVRKDSDKNHSHRSIEANCEPDALGNWIFIDDLIDTGDTQKRVHTAIKEWVEDDDPEKERVTKYLGHYLYEDNMLKIEGSDLV